MDYSELIGILADGKDILDDVRAVRRWRELWHVIDRIDVAVLGERETLLKAKLPEIDDRVKALGKECNVAQREVAGVRYHDGPDRDRERVRQSRESALLKVRAEFRLAEEERQSVQAELGGIVRKRQELSTAERGVWQILNDHEHIDFAKLRSGRDG